MFVQWSEKGSTMGKFATTGLAMGVMLVIGAPAEAATITRTFTGTLVFTDGGPVTATTFSFGFTYDPAAGLSNRPVDYFTASTSYPSFNAMPIYVSYVGQGFSVDGAGGGGLYYDRPDFFISAYDDPSMPGAFPASFRVGGYTVGDGSTLHSASFGSTLIETTGVTAVPEPTSWALLIGGFGLIGGTLRTRVRKIGFAVA